MRRLAIIYCLLALAFAAQAQKKDYCINVGDFAQLTVVNNVNVVHCCSADSAGYATFSCDPQIASAITFSNNKSKLKVEIVSDDPLVSVPTVTVYSLSLTDASNWGDSTLTVIRNTPGAKFKANVIGNGNIVARDMHVTQIEASVKAGQGHVFLSGKAQTAKYSIMSAGAVEALELEAQKVSCSMIGTGSIDCYPLSELKVTGMGPGHIYFKGDPSVKNHGVGVKVIQIN